MNIKKIALQQIISVMKEIDPGNYNNKEIVIIGQKFYKYACENPKLYNEFSREFEKTIKSLKNDTCPFNWIRDNYVSALKKAGWALFWSREYCGNIKYAKENLIASLRIMRRMRCTMGSFHSFTTQFNEDGTITKVCHKCGRRDCYNPRTLENKVLQWGRYERRQ